jgi:hypothetical protein
MMSLHKPGIQEDSHGVIHLPEFLVPEPEARGEDEEKTGLYIKNISI